MTSQITMKCKGKGVQCVLHLSATFSPQPFSLLHWAELLTLSLCLGFDLQLRTLERPRLPIDLQRLLSAHPCLAEKARGMMRVSAIWTFVLQCRQMHICLWPKKGCAGYSSLCMWSLFSQIRECVVCSVCMWLRNGFMSWNLGTVCYICLQL